MYLDSQINQINTLEKENKEVEEKLRKRETDLYKYRFKIKDLKKSKQVLTHRTYEMRSNLKPKDAKIQLLKDEYLMTEEAFDKQMGELQKQEKEMHAIKSRISQFNKQIKLKKDQGDA